MTVPRATYRLQFRNGMDFERAAGVIPYLARLGVSHLYASPIFAAASGSTHGYDVTDHNSFDPVLGGEEGFERLSHALKKAGLGLILDIVPNHMAASVENPWWQSVLEWGIESPYHGYFDINWREKLTLPILGRPYAEALADGELSLEADAEQGRLTLRYFDNRLPLGPATYRRILHSVDGPVARRIEEAASKARLDSGLTQTVKGLLADIAARDGLRRELARLSRDPAAIDAVHAVQPWRLIFWKDARRHLSYRRFFEVTGLVGLRVEVESVFDDVHRLTLRLVREGKVDGLRIDHVDGLADPARYLGRLREEAGPDCYLVVEKILGADETLPPGWPIQGTTGYEFIADMAGLFTDAGQQRALDSAYAAAVGAPADLPAQIRSAKRDMLLDNFAGEFKAVRHLAATSAVYMDNRRSALDEIDEAIAELILAFPVYRIYGGLDGGLTRRDAELLNRIAEDVRSGGRVAPHALELVLKLLRLDVPAPALPTARHFRLRFQQLTGPIMAKSLEDTLFYRFNRSIALNEVGGEPLAEAGDVGRFHARMAERAHEQPGGLSATATHDTKRGEDARARLHAISEAPEAWGEAVARWRGMHADRVGDLPDGRAPEAETEWLVYQALAGIWPDRGEHPGAEELKQMAGRFLPYVEKALREAKRRTGWTDVNEPYEAAVKNYAARLLAPDNMEFLNDFRSTLQPFIRAGGINALSQTLIKLVAPGVPDIYQGSETGDFSLVDPDNRRMVDFDGVSRTLTSGAVPFGPDELASGKAKQALIAACLSFRKTAGALFSGGDYVPLTATGRRAGHVVAFARVKGERAVLAVAPRLLLGWFTEHEDIPDAGFWGDTALDVPDGIGSGLRNVLTGEEHDREGRLPVAGILKSSPVALLASF